MSDVREAWVGKKSKKAPPGVQIGRLLRTCASRGVPADHEAQKPGQRKKQLQERNTQSVGRAARVPGGEREMSCQNT